MKGHSEASERNRAPILAILKRVFADRRHVLEIGSGTGQHAAYFAPELAHLSWQPSDVAENLPSVRLWREEAQTPRLLEPLELDVNRPFPKVSADAVFSANTSHIMSWPQVERMFDGMAKIDSLKIFCLYGPFNYGGQYTSNCDDSPLKPVIDNLRSFGIATVVATGNDSRRDAIAYPACISSTISVGSTFKSGTIDTFWTNAAPFMTFFAPGTRIVSSVPLGLFQAHSGTSMAAPHVAGVMAVLRQASSDERSLARDHRSLPAQHSEPLPNGFNENQRDHHHQTCRDPRIQLVVEDEPGIGRTRGRASQRTRLRQKSDAGIRIENLVP